MTHEHKYKMSISLNVLNHLGIGLYSSIPAVLSEIVANAWDADATIVQVCFRKDEDKIIVSDNGHGMDLNDINAKYLNVGYDKRRSEPPVTKTHLRKPMGRKGIGKLSVFAIADVIEVFTARNGEKHALKMDARTIAQLTEDPAVNNDYSPEVLETESIDFEAGTRIELSALKTNVTKATSKYLRQRVSRRFSIIGTENDFEVYVDDVAITPGDRGYYSFIQFLWQFGEESKRYADLVANAVEYELLENTLNVDDIHGTVDDFKIKGWLGTVKNPSQLKDSSKGIVIYAKGKLIHENFLPELDDARLFTEYLVGEIDADFMDLDELDDIITSNRQSVKDDDPRYEALRTLIKTSLNRIGNRWTKLRNQISLDLATENMYVKEWYESLRPGQQKYARRMFGNIETLGLPNDESLRQVYKMNILAFTRLSLKHELDILNDIKTAQDMNTLMRLFGSVDELEAHYYYEIVKGRLDVIEKFQYTVDENAVERILQQYLFNHLWLLEPSWERATFNTRMEQSVTKEFMKIEDALTEDERAGRIDIRYQTLGGKHVIIELKKSDRRVDLFELAKQVNKYYTALQKCLTDKFPGYYPQYLIEVVCILGKPPIGGRDPKHIADVLNTSCNARHMTYDELILQAQNSYGEYLQAQSRIGRLSQLVERIIDDIEPNAYRLETAEQLQ